MRVACTAPINGGRSAAHAGLLYLTNGVDNRGVGNVNLLAWTHIPNKEEVVGAGPVSVQASMLFPSDGVSILQQSLILTGTVEVASARVPPLPRNLRKC